MPYIQAVKVLKEIIPDKLILSILSSKYKKNAGPILKLLAPYKEEDSISWEELTDTRMKKHSAPGVAHRGARIKENMSQA